MTLPFDWIISDTHFGHKNISKYCWRTTPTCPTPAAVDALMINNWTASVQPNDTILHLGDLCKWDQGEFMQELYDLPGKKYILRGNHDLYPDKWYADHGFEILSLSDTAFAHHCELGEAIVQMTHYPTQIPNDAVNIHGHTHNNPHHSTPSHLNVSVELTHFAPVRLERAVEKVMWHHTRGGRDNEKSDRRRKK